MFDTWLKYCYDWGGEPALFYSGSRKIIRGKTVTFPVLDDSIGLREIGYTKAKLKHLERSYLHEESRDAAVKLWETRVHNGGYGSVGFHCYNHYIKGRGLSYWEKVRHASGKGPEPTSKHGSVMGPCIQAVVLTLLKKGEVHVDLFYRTTEWYKKFPADLIFLHEMLLKPFNLTNVSGYTFHFANVTMHPMYWIVCAQVEEDPISHLYHLKKQDPHYYRQVVKWTVKHICEEHFASLMKFRQAAGVGERARREISKAQLAQLQKFLRKEHASL